MWVVSIISSSICIWKSLLFQISSDFPSILRIVRRTLLARQIDENQLLCHLKDVLQQLLDADLVQQIVSIAEDDKPPSSPKLRASQLGRASVQGAVDPSRSDRLLTDLRHAQNSLNMSSHFHLLYLVVPYDIAEGIKVDWQVLYHRMESMTTSEVSLLASLGLTEAVVARKASGMNCRKVRRKNFHYSLLIS